MYIPPPVFLGPWQLLTFFAYSSGSGRSKLSVPFKLCHKMHAESSIHKEVEYFGLLQSFQSLKCLFLVVIDPLTEPVV